MADRRLSDVKALPMDAVVKTTPLDGLTQAFKVDSTDRIDNRNIDISVATGLSVDEVDTKISDGDNTPINDAKNAVGDVVGNAINNSINEGVDQETAASAILDTQEKKTGMDRFTDFVLEGALTVDDPNFNPALARMLTNQQIAFEIMSERFKGAQEQGTGATVLDFIDRYLLRQIPIGALEDLTRRSRS